MTFNVNGSSHPPEGPNAWSRRQALNVAVIVRHDPDLIGSQEVAEDNLAVYRKRLTGYDHVVGNAYVAAGNLDGAASTFHGDEGESYDARRYSGGHNTFWRVDWMLARAATQPIGTAACRIVRDADPPAYPSDHYPVLAELQIGP